VFEAKYVSVNLGAIPRGSGIDVYRMNMLGQHCNTTLIAIKRLNYENFGLLNADEL
jgi:hypothetical protein